MLLILLLLQTLVLTPGEPQIVTLDDGPLHVIYEAAAAETVTITARSQTGDTPIDVTLEVLYGEDRLAFNDDHFTGRENLLLTDAAIEALMLPRAGRYTIRVNSFNGMQAGPVELLLQVEQIPPCEAGQVLMLRRGAAYTCTVEIEAGAVLALTARDTGGTLDPVLALLDATGAVVAFNDDHSSGRTDLNTLDAHISGYAPAQAGIYTVRVTDFSGAAGTFALSISDRS